MQITNLNYTEFDKWWRNYEEEMTLEGQLADRDPYDIARDAYMAAIDSVRVKFGNTSVNPAKETQPDNTQLIQRMDRLELQIKAEMKRNQEFHTLLYKMVGALAGLDLDIEENYDD